MPAQIFSARRQKQRAAPTPATTKKGTEMTDTITSDAEQSATGTIEHIDPHTLIVDTNVRDDAYVDAQFVASIKEHGVLVPIAGVRGDDGNVRVRAGQRRTLAAREAGLPTVPVYVRAATAADENSQLIERVAEQIVENDHRSDLTDAQRARGIQQMIDAGMSVTKVAKKLAIARAPSKPQKPQRSPPPRWMPWLTAS
jgi:ParB family chromosome partitioning protein